MNRRLSAELLSEQEYGNTRQALANGYSDSKALERVGRRARNIYFGLYAATLIVSDDVSLRLHQHSFHELTPGIVVGAAIAAPLILRSIHRDNQADKYEETAAELAETQIWLDNLTDHISPDWAEAATGLSSFDITKGEPEVSLPFANDAHLPDVGQANPE